MPDRPEDGPASRNSHDGFADLARACTDGRLTRRELLARAAVLGLSGSALGALLAACGGSSEPKAAPVAMDTTLPQQITLYNWEFYSSPKALKGFEKLHGVKVVEKTFGSQDELYKVMQKDSGAFDVIMASDFWVKLLREGGLVQPLDMSRIPNFKYVTQPVFRKPSFDPEADGKKYSVPYMFGSVGFAVRLDKIHDPLPKWDILYDPAYKQQLSMLDGSREVLGPALFSLGYPLNTTDQAQLDEATAKAIKQKPLVTVYDSGSMKARILEGLPLVQCWDGDAVGAMNEMGLSKIRYVLPQEGYQIWADAVCVPTSAPSAYAAHLFLDYLLDPAVAAENANYLGYQPVVEAADPMIKSLVQRAMRPTPDVIAAGTLAEDLGEFNAAYDAAYEKVTKA